MLFHQLTQLDPDYYLVLVTSEHFQRTFSNSLPPDPHWGRRPLRRSECQLPRPGPAARTAAALGSRSAAAAGAPRCPSSGPRRAAAPLGCWERAACFHSGSLGVGYETGPVGCLVMTVHCLLIQTKPSVTCGICLMFVCLFSFHLYFVSLFVCFGFLFKFSLGF